MIALQNRARRRAWIVLALVMPAVFLLGAITFAALPRLAPRLLVCLGYQASGNCVLYLGWKSDPRLEDENVIVRKRFSFLPGPHELEVLRYNDGVIAMIATASRKKILYRVNFEDSPTWQGSPGKLSQRPLRWQGATPSSK